MDATTLERMLATLPGRRLLVVGDVMLDEYLWGDSLRLSPEAPVPVVEVRERTFLSGGAANAAANVVGLGGTAYLAGVVGQDEPAGRLAEALRRQGVGADGLLRDPERFTTTKTRLIARGQQVVRMDCEQRQPLSASLEDALLRWTDRHLAEADACLVSDYGKGVVSPRVAQHLIRAARAAGKPVVVDPKGTDYAKYRGATVIKPNLHEVERFLKEEIDSEAALLEAGRRLTVFLEGTAVLVTRGADGMALFRADQPLLRVGAAARKVFDVTGAGDTVVSTLSLALAAGCVLEVAVPLANLAAAVVVAKRGTAIVTMEELRLSITGADNS